MKKIIAVLSISLFLFTCYLPAAVQDAGSKPAQKEQMSSTAKSTDSKAEKKGSSKSCCSKKSNAKKCSKSKSCEKDTEKQSK